MLKLILIASLILVTQVPAMAAPFVPSDDAQVLERLPDRSGGEYREVVQLRDRSRAMPDDADAAAALAEAYYRISRREGDPRYLGYAQAALTKWWKEPAPPAAVLLARAVILQSTHAFEQSLKDLDLVVADDPGNARAILVRATVKTVIGRYADARADCLMLKHLTQALPVIGCIAGVESLAGRADDARNALVQVLAAVPDASADQRSWVSSLLGEIAARQGDDKAASYFQAALADDPNDLYTIGAYCDWLFDHGRAADVVPFTRDKIRVDSLLLRLALAQKALGVPEAESTIQLLRARFDASRARGDTVHRREEARFRLFLENDAAGALRLALDNWQVQREPADLRILAETAKATGDGAAVDLVRQWFKDTKLEYPAVAELVR